MTGASPTRDRRAFPLAALILAAVLAATGCTPGSGRGRDRPPGPDLHPEMLKSWSKMVRRYIAALVLCRSERPQDWGIADGEFSEMKGFHIYPEEKELVYRFHHGDSVARKELGRRGTLYEAMSAFWKPLDKKHPKALEATLHEWERARLTMLAWGEGGPELLSITLISMLLNTDHREAWDHIRFILGKSGPTALATSVATAKELASTMSRSPLFRGDDMNQVLLVIIGFGDEGRPEIEAFSRHDNPNVRRTVARAIGEAKDASGADLILRLLGDPEWSVRAAAAEAAGNLGPAKATLGPALLAHAAKEKERFVLERIFWSIGQMDYAPAVPRLVEMLAVPSYRVREAMMVALYRITGRRLTTREKWQKWFREDYPAWKIDLEQRR